EARRSFSPSIGPERDAPTVSDAGDNPDVLVPGKHAPICSAASVADSKVHLVGAHQDRELVLVDGLRPPALGQLLEEIFRKLARLVPYYLLSAIEYDVRKMKMRIHASGIPRGGGRPERSGGST